MLIMHTVDSEHLYTLQVVLVWVHWHAIFTHTIIATVAMVMVTVVRRPIAGCYQYTRGRYGALCSCSFNFTDELTTKKYCIFVGLALPVAITNCIIHSHLNVAVAGCLYNFALKMTMKKTVGAIRGTIKFGFYFARSHTAPLASCTPLKIHFINLLK